MCWCHVGAGASFACQSVPAVASTCSAGYSVSGATCALSNAANVKKPPDGHCGIARSGNTYAADSNDPDCVNAGYGTGASSVPQLNKIQPSVGLIGFNNGSRNVVISQPTTGGNITISITTPDANGNSKTSNIVLGPIGTGAGCGPLEHCVIGTSTTTTSGTGTGATTAVVPEPAGGAAADTTPKPDQFCVTNPTSPICVNATFSGSCGTEPACTGDAAMCAIAQKTFDMWCIATSTTAASTLGNQLGTSGDPLSSTLPTKDNATSVDVSGAIATTSFWSSSCPADLTVALGSHSFVIPWSRLCSVFTLLGYLMVALAGITCARIVGVWG
jgi:hypothetical protein